MHVYASYFVFYGRCRICHEELESNKTDLLFPCLCKGTRTFVHQECLKTWIQVSQSTECEVYLAKYEANVNLNRYNINCEETFLIIFYSREACLPHTPLLSQYGLNYLVYFLNYPVVPTCALQLKIGKLT